MARLSSSNSSATTLVASRCLTETSAPQTPSVKVSWADHFLLALFGVTDLFYYYLGNGPIKENVLRLELRQTAMGHDEERLIQWSFYYELFDRIWPSLPKVPEADEAFQWYTQLTINEYLSLGFAFSQGSSRSAISGRLPISFQRNAFLASPFLNRSGVHFSVSRRDRSRRCAKL